MKVSLLVLGLLGGLWSARSLADDAGPWESADRHVTFYDDGSPRARLTLVEGRFEGPASTWYRGGRRESEGAYADGEREGPWCFWGVDGALDPERSGLYETGVRVAPFPR